MTAQSNGRMPDAPDQAEKNNAADESIRFDQWRLQKAAPADLLTADENN